MIVSIGIILAEGVWIEYRFIIIMWWLTSGIMLVVETSVRKD